MLVSTPEELTRAIGQIRAARTELMRLETRLNREDRIFQQAEVNEVRKSLGTELEALEMLSVALEGAGSTTA
jgi:hypothetical protein